MEPGGDDGDLGVGQPGLRVEMPRVHPGHKAGAAADGRRLLTDGARRVGEGGGRLGGGHQPVFPLRRADGQGQGQGQRRRESQGGKAGKLHKTPLIQYDLLICSSIFRLGISRL